jgi:2-haloacid dehalogenase
MCGRFGAARGKDADWPALVDAWRGAYVPSMERVRRGESPWLNLDALHRASLETLLPRFGFDEFTANERHELVMMWHRLDPWPDAVPGLARLRERVLIATLSNGNVTLLADMAKHAALPWDAILSAELVHHYKPDPETYALAIEVLGEGRPEHVLMVAAHNGDLRHAKDAGMPTAFVARPAEYGPAQTRDLTAEPFVDVAVNSLEELADLFA